MAIERLVRQALGDAWQDDEDDARLAAEQASKVTFARHRMLGSGTDRATAADNAPDNAPDTEQLAILPEELIDAGLLPSRQALTRDIHMELKRVALEEVDDAERTAQQISSMIQFTVRRSPTIDTASHEQKSGEVDRQDYKRALLEAEPDADAEDADRAARLAGHTSVSKETPRLRQPVERPLQVELVSLAAKAMAEIRQALREAREQDNIDEVRPFQAPALTVLPADARLTSKGPSPCQYDKRELRQALIEGEDNEAEQLAQNQTMGQVRRGVRWTKFRSLAGALDRVGPLTESQRVAFQEAVNRTARDIRGTEGDETDAYRSARQARRARFTRYRLTGDPTLAARNEPLPVLPPEVALGRSPSLPSDLRHAICQAYENDLAELALPRSWQEAKDWDESLHPRDETGKFGSGGGAGEQTDTSLEGEKEPRPKEFPPQESVEEVAAKMTELHPNTRFDFSSCDVETANDVAYQLHGLMDKYPTVKLSYVGTDPSEPQMFGWSPKAETYAITMAYTDGHSAIGLNPAWFGNRDALQQSLAVGADTGWHPAGTNSIEGIVTHEFGHAYDNSLSSGPLASAQWAPAVRASGFGMVGPTFDQWQEDHTEQARAESGYSKSNPSDKNFTQSEGFAEAFAAQELAAPAVQSPFSKSIGTLQRTLGDPSEWITDKNSIQYQLDMSGEERSQVGEDLAKLAKRIGVRTY